MNNRVTIKDIADKAGVSIGTVHCALSGKPGVGENTRKRILDIANHLGYRPNTVAAALKRKTLRVAASFPGPTEESRYYYNFIWEGVKEWFRTQSDYNIELVECPFYLGTNSHSNKLRELLGDGNIDGLLTTGETDQDGLTAIGEVVSNKIPVFLVSTDAPDSGRMCCVMPNYEVIGRITAELLLNQIREDAGVLVCAGSVTSFSHYMIVNGFKAYMEENHYQNPLHIIHPENIGRESIERVKKEIVGQAGLGACLAVNTRGSLILGEAIKELGLAGKYRVVGNDMFHENIAFLKEGIFTNLINKKPYTQAYTAAKYMTEYLIIGQRPPVHAVYIGAEAVFKSSLLMIDGGYFGLMR